MCFFYHTSKKAIQKKHSAKISSRDLLKFSENFNAFEFPIAPVILNKNPDKINLLNWGLIPSWSKNNDIRKFTLNARIETLEEKPSFQSSVNNRCLVLASGFYEWQWLDSKEKKKQKYHIQSQEEKLFSFAGLWSEWNDLTTGELQRSYTIITTEANDLMRKIHNTKQRMPVILKANDEQKWLEGSPIQNFQFPYQTQLKADKILTDNEQSQLLLF